MLIRFNQIDEFTTVRGGEFRNLVLFDYEFFDKICNKVKCLISERNGITDSINHNFRKITTDSYNSLPIEKILNFHSDIIRIKMNTTII